MRQKIAAFCDPDRRYLERLSAFIDRQRKPPLLLAMEGFTNLQSLEQYLEKNTPSCLLLAQEYAGAGERKTIRKLFSGPCAVLAGPENEEIRLTGKEGISGEEPRKDDLTEESVPMEAAGETEWPRILKYQAADTLLEEIQGLIRGEEKEEPIATGSRKEPESFLCPMIGIYSPVGRCGKTSFAQTLGMILSQEGKQVLYLCLDEFGSQTNESTQIDLSDLFYEWRGKNGLIDPERLDQAVLATGRSGFRMLASPASPLDLWDITPGEWKGVLEAIGNRHRPDVMILDMGTQFREAYRLLPFCRILFVPSSHDPLSARKIQNCKTGFRLLDNREMEEKMCVLFLPELPREDYEGDPGKLAAGTMGHFVRKLLKSRQWPGPGLME